MKNGTDRNRTEGGSPADGRKAEGRSTARLLGRLFGEFLKFGFLTISGGMAMIPRMQRLAVEVSAQKRKESEK